MEFGERVPLVENEIETMAESDVSRRVSGKRSKVKESKRGKQVPGE